MPVLLLVFVLVATAAVVAAGIVLTLRAFKEDKEPAAPRPQRVVSPPHDAPTNAALKRYFEGRACYVCHRAIPVVHAGDRRPGLLNSNTHAVLGWNDIPSQNLNETLDGHVPVCASCLEAEVFRQKFPELVIDRPAHTH